MINLKRIKLSQLALIFSLSALAVMLIPILGKPIAFGLAVAGFSIGIIAWIRNDNRTMSGGAVALAAIVVILRYVFMALFIVIILAGAYFFIKKEKSNR